MSMTGNLHKIPSSRKLTALVCGCCFFAIDIKVSHLETHPTPLPPHPPFSRVPPETKGWGATMWVATIEHCLDIHVPGATLCYSACRRPSFNMLHVSTRNRGVPEQIALTDRSLRMVHRQFHPKWTGMGLILERSDENQSSTTATVFDDRQPVTGNQEPQTTNRQSTTNHQPVAIDHRLATNRYQSPTAINHQLTINRDQPPTSN